MVKNNGDAPLLHRSVGDAANTLLRALNIKQSLNGKRGLKDAAEFGRTREEVDALAAEYLKILRKYVQSLQEAVDG